MYRTLDTLYNSYSHLSLLHKKTPFLFRMITTEESQPNHLSSHNKVYLARGRVQWAGSCIMHGVEGMDGWMAVRTDKGRNALQTFSRPNIPGLLLTLIHRHPLEEFFVTLAEGFDLFTSVVESVDWKFLKYY